MSEVPLYGVRVRTTCSGSEAGSYLRLIDCVYHSTLGLRVIKREREVERERQVRTSLSLSLLLSSLELTDTQSL